METSPLLYITYHPLDSEFALSLAADLKNAGVPAWLDLLDVLNADDWQAQTASARGRTQAVIAILSPAYLQSEETRAELIAFQERGLPVLALMLHAVTPDHAHHELIRSPLFDFQHWRQPRAYGERLNRLISAVLASTSFTLDLPDAETRYCTRLIAQVVMRRERALLSAGDYAARSHSPLAALWGADVSLALHMPNSVDTDVQLRVESAAAALEQFQRVIVTGDYGSGKTAVLERAVLDAAESFQQAWSRTHVYSPAAPLPLLLSLAEWPREVAFVDFLRASYALAPDLIDLLRTGCAALYLDGLDEMAGEQAEADPNAPRIAALQAWLTSRDAPRTILFSCRTHRSSEMPALRELSLPVIAIEPMNDAQIEQFVRAALDAQAADALIGLITHGDAPEGLRIAVRSRFALARLIALCRAAPPANAGALPRSAGDILHRWLGVQWVASRLHQVTLTVERYELHIALAALAQAVLQRDRRTWPSVEAAEWMEVAVGVAGRGGDLLHAGITLGILEARGGRVMFATHGLVDLFAALVMTNDLTPYLTSPRLTAQGERIDTRWDDALALYVGWCAKPDAVLLAVSEVDALLAVQMLGQGITPAPPTLQTIMSRLSVGADQAVEANAASDGTIRASSSSALAREVPVLADRAFMRLAQVLPMTSLIDLMRGGSARTRRMALGFVRAQQHSNLAFEAQTDSPLEPHLQRPPEEALPRLVQALQSADWERRRMAVRLLGEYGDEAAVPALIEALADSEIPVRVEAVRALSALSSSAATDALIRALADANPAVQRAIAQSVSTRPEAVPGLITFGLHHHEPAVRRIAASALGDLADSSAWVALLDATFDPDSQARSAAVEALGKLHEPEAMNRLCECLHDNALSHHGEGRICDFAKDGLLALRLPESDLAVQAWLQTQTQELRHWNDLMHGTAHKAADTDAVIALIDQLPGVLDNQALAQLNACLHHAQIAIQGAALNRLRESPSVQALQLLFAALPGLQAEAAYEDACILAEMSAHFPDEAMPRWAAALGHRQPSVRAIAAYVLGQIGDRSVLESLNTCLYDRTLVKDGFTVGSYVQDAISQIESRGTAHNDMAYDTEEEATTGQPPVGDDLPLPQQAEDEPLLVTLTDWIEALLPFPDDVSTDPPHPDSSPPPELPMFKDDLADTEPTPRDSWPELPMLLDAMRASNNEIQRARIAKEIGTLAFHRGKARAANPTPPDPAIRAHLLRALVDPMWLLRAVACEVFAHLPDADAAAALVLRLTDDEIEVRLSAIRALGEAADGRALPALSERAQDAHPKVRAAAAEALGRLGARAPIKLLMSLSVDREQIVRRTALDVLDALEDKRSVPAFIHALRDPNLHIRFIAVSALSRLHDARSVEPLIACLSSQETAIYAGHTFSEVAATALSAIGTSDALAAVRAWQMEHVGRGGERRA